MTHSEMAACSWKIYRSSELLLLCEIANCSQDDYSGLDDWSENSLWMASISWHYGSPVRACHLYIEVPVALWLINLWPPFF